MAEYTVKRIDELDAAVGGAFKRARAELGVESFGMQVMDLPANMGDAFPAHDHSDSGQEEVYVVLSGTGEIEIDGERLPLDTDTLVRVGPTSRRTFYTDGEPMRVLALGGVPGQAYEPGPSSRIGGPEPVPTSR